MLCEATRSLPLALPATALLDACNFICSQLREMAPIHEMRLHLPHDSHGLLS